MGNFTLGQAIYIAIKPLFKIYLTMGLGFLMAKKGIITVDSSRTISMIVLNYLLPALIFSNIVLNIKDTDIKLLGVILLSAYLYFAVGGAWAFFIRLTTPIPKAWFGGLLVACIINNSGDLPIAYVQTLGQSSAFPANSTSVGTAYCVLYSIGFLSFMFNLGGQRLLVWDAERKGDDKFEPTVPPFSVEKLAQLAKRLVRRGDASSESTEKATSVPKNQDEESQHGLPDADASGEEASTASGTRDSSRAEEVMHYHAPPTRARRHRPSAASEMSNATGIESFTSEIRRLSSRQEPMSGQEEHLELNATSDVVSLRPPRSDDHALVTSRAAMLRASWLAHWRSFRNKNMVTLFVANFITDMARPQALAIIFSLLICMIPWVRRLFVDDPDQYIKGIPNAPDGKPPLDFVMNFTQFIGQTQVQFGLILLGGTIARLRVGVLVRGFWKTIVSMVIFKLIVLPIIALAWVTALRRMNWIDPNDAMAVIVLVASAATPSATVQIYITTLLSDPNEPMIQLNCFSVCLIVCYITLPITMTILMTYTLMNIL